MRPVLLVLLSVAVLVAQDADTHLRRAQEIVKGLTPGRPDPERLDEAQKELAAALRLRPDDIVAQYELANVQLLRKSFGAAMDAVGGVLRADPKHLEAQLLRGRILVAMGKPGVARLFLKDALEQYPNNPEILLAIGQSCLADRDPDAAEQAYKELQKLEPGTARVIEGLVSVLFARDKPDQAVALAKAEAAKAPDRADLQRLLGIVAINARRYDEAIGVLRPLAEKLGSGGAETWTLVADAYLRKDDPAGSAEAMKKACDLEPRDNAYRLSLAVTADAAGQKQVAEQAYRSVLANQPNNAQALNNLAYLMADRGGDLTEALVLAVRARDLRPTNPEIADTVGWVYLKSGKADIAEPIFQVLMNRYKTNPAFRYHYALTLLARGAKESALTELRRALDDKPAATDEPRIRELIDKLSAEKPK